jgi:hypothetical protein
MGEVSLVITQFLGRHQTYRHAFRRQRPKRAVWSHGIAHNLYLRDRSLIDCVKRIGSQTLFGMSLREIDRS